MTGNIVKLVFQSVAQGSGFAKVSAETAELRKNLGLASGAIGQLSQAFGTIGRLAGGAVSDLLRGNIWSLAARSCGFLIDKIKEHNKLMKDAAFAARGLSREYMTLEYAQAGYQKRVEGWRRAKEAADKAEKEAAEARKKEAEAAKSMEKDRLTFEQKYYSLEKQIGEEIKKRESLNADELTQLKEKARAMIAAADLSVRNAKGNLAYAKEHGSGYDQDIAQKELDLELQRRKTISAEVRKMAEDYKRQKKLKEDEFEEWERKNDEEIKAELEKTRLEERRNEIRNNGAKAIKEIEDKIVAAKEEAARLEENAAKARGVGFGDWMREGRNEDRANRTEARRQANREKQVSQELDRLEKTNPRTRTRWQNERIAKLREWQADQDPANNPALNKVKQLQAQKDKIQEDMLTELQKISAALDAATTL